MRYWKLKFYEDDDHFHKYARAIFIVQFHQDVMNLDAVMRKCVDKQKKRKVGCQVLISMGLKEGRTPV